jgi:hypothetical protein
MALTIPNKFATRTVSFQLSEVDTNFQYLASELDRISLGLTVSGTAVTLNGSATLSNTLNVTGATILSSTLGVTGATTLSSTLGVTGAITATGNTIYSSDGSSGLTLNTTTKKVNRLFAGWSFDEEGGVFTPVGKTRVVFGPTGANQTWTAPSTGYIYVKLWGAGGGGGNSGGWSFGSPGGGGGHSHALIPVISGTVYYIVVGSGGQSLYAGGQTAGYGGGGGLSSNTDNRYAGQGGGYCGIFSSSTISQANALLIAGGGGGGGSSRMFGGNWGGAGGGLVAQQGNSPWDNKPAYGGGPGTQSAGGAAGTGAQAGSALTGGYGGTTANPYGGGGGGGYWGGGGGGYIESNTMAGAGGGSGYVSSSAIFGGTFTGSQQHPAFFWDNDLPTTTDSYRNSAKYGYGGDVGYTATVNGVTAYGGSGYCVIYY